MAKITLNPIVGSYASVLAVNARLQQIEDAFNDNVLWRDGFTSEPNSMAVDLDMAGFNLLNVASLELADQVGYAEEWASKAEGSLISVAAGGDGSTEYSSLHWAAKAAADAILTAADVVSTGEDLVETAQDVIDTQAIYTLFDDRYLGSKAAAPTTLNDAVTPLGAAHEGIEYWNSTTNDRWTWDGAAWGLTSSSVATSANLVSISDAGNYYTIDNAEAALQELRPGLGTWTPEITAAVPGTGWVYGVQNGQWSRVGNLLFLSFTCTVTTKGSGALGKILITGLPSYTSADGANYNTAGAIKELKGITLNTGYTQFSLIHDGTDLRVQELGHPTSGSTGVDVSVLTAPATIAGSIIINLAL